MIREPTAVRCIALKRYTMFHLKKYYSFSDNAMVYNDSISNVRAFPEQGLDWAIGGMDSMTETLR